MTKRFVIENAELIVKYLHATGADKDAKLIQPSKNWWHAKNWTHNPSNPYATKPMKTIETKVSNDKLHSIAVVLGLIKD